MIKSYSGVSGKYGYQEPTVHNQMLKNKGPIPAGRYRIYLSSDVNQAPIRVDIVNGIPFVTVLAGRRQGFEEIPTAKRYEWGHYRARPRAR